MHWLERPWHLFLKPVLGSTIHFVFSPEDPGESPLHWSLSRGGQPPLGTLSFGALATSHPAWLTTVWPNCRDSKGTAGYQDPARFSWPFASWWPLMIESTVCGLFSSWTPLIMSEGQTLQHSPRQPSARTLKAQWLARQKPYIPGIWTAEIKALLFLRSYHTAFFSFHTVIFFFFFLFLGDGEEEGDS